ncbi:MAG: putative transcriptional regulator, PucR family [Firmicutes bacterium]|nr:putative transcriptional regulator, PucR family [Bacillota bacterium]
MWINLAILVGELEKVFSVQTYGHISREVTKIERLSVSASEILLPDVLYFTTPAGLERMGTVNAPAPLLCVADQYLLIDQSLFPGKTVIVVRNDDMSKVMLKLAEIMYELGLRSSKLSELAQTLLSCSELNQMLDAGFSFLGNPIIVVDSHQKVIGCTKIEGDKDVLGFGHFTLDSTITVEQIQEKCNDVICSSPDGSLSDCDAGCPVLTKKLIVGGREEGYLQAMAILKPFSEYDREAVAVLGNFIAIELLRLHISTIRETDLGKAEAFLKTLLDSSLVNSNVINTGTSALNLKLKKYLYVLTIQTKKQNEGGGAAMHRIIASLTYVLPGSKGFIYKNSIILLHSVDRRIVDFQAAFAALIPVLEGNGLHGGISNAFFSVVDIRAQYFQARKAVELGPRFDPDKHFYAYERYSVYHMMELSSTFDNLISFCHSSIFNLLEHDADIGGELVTTLYVYLKNGSNKNKTSKELHVHLNTIKYRLSQISEILGVNLADEEIAFSLYHTLKILRFIKAFPTDSNTSRYLDKIDNSMERS